MTLCKTGSHNSTIRKYGDGEEISRIKKKKKKETQFWIRREYTMGKGH